MASKKEENFEAIYQRLEGTATRLEEGGLTLQESLDLYEEGMKLAQRCQELLQQAELKVTRLREAFTNGGGALREETPSYGTEGAQTDPAEPEGRE